MCHVTLTCPLWSTPSCLYWNSLCLFRIPNLKRLASSVLKIQQGSKNLKIGHMTSTTLFLGQFVMLGPACHVKSQQMEANYLKKGRGQFT